MSYWFYLRDCILIFQLVTPTTDANAKCGFGVNHGDGRTPNDAKSTNTNTVSTLSPEPTNHYVQQEKSFSSPISKYSQRICYIYCRGTSLGLNNYYHLRAVSVKMKKEKDIEKLVGLGVLVLVPGLFPAYFPPTEALDFKGHVRHAGTTGHSRL
jgi:hypothetical protein